ncbi:MAG: folylpolyglutamate synthase/dihydrofolate synthase family protein [Clostridia bacterium]|nr:folylpolyglutamate synthase/dihydrofolate synthase family protein [Clostridia bacterium]
MTFEETLDYIYSRRKFAESSSLERISAVLSVLSDEHKKLKFVHVLGTNGKGSVSEMISSCLSASGYKTGLFTSPFVLDFRERIQIDGKFIEKEDFCRIAETVKEKSELLPEVLRPTFFEFVLAVALVYFYESGCDVVVLEAGIGGRDDSTNIIPPPLLTVFTSISLDHTDVLGSTIGEIAKNKAGAIKKGSAVISFPTEDGGFDFIPQSKEVADVLRLTAKEKDCKILFPDMKKLTLTEESIFETKFSFDGLPLSIRLPGEHQLGNSACALTALKELKALGFDLKSESIQKGMHDAFLPARAEVVKKEPLTIIDGGHNEGAAKTLKKLINRHLKEKKITLLAAYMKDKDYETALSLLAPECENIVFTLADEKRGEDPKRLKACAEKYCKNIFCENDRKKALQKAESLLSKNSALLIAGSFYLAAEERKNFDV